MRLREIVSSVNQSVQQPGRRPSKQSVSKSVSQSVISEHSSCMWACAPHPKKEHNPDIYDGPRKHKTIKLTRLWQNSKNNLKYHKITKHLQIPLTRFTPLFSTLLLWRTGISAIAYLSTSRCSAVVAARGACWLFFDISPRSSDLDTRFSALWTSLVS